MSKKARVDPKVQADQTQSLATIRQPTAGEAALTSEAMGLKDWINKGDYRERPKNLFFNFADPASRDRQRRMQMNSRGQGVYALGAPDANLLAMEKQNLDDEWARDTAGQYESDVSQAGLRASGALGDVAGMANTRNLGALSATSGMWGQSLNASANQKKWWEYLLQGAQAGAGAAAQAFGGGGGG